MRSSVVAAVLALGALTACSGASPGASSGGGATSSRTSATTPSAAPSGSSPSSTGSPAPAAVISNLDALQTVTAYPKAATAAAKARSSRAAGAIQTGPQLALSLADFRYSIRAHVKPIRAVALSAPGTLIPAATGTRKWFLSTAYAEAGEANYVSVFELGPGSRWRKSMEVWLGDSSFPDPTVTADGAAAVPDAAGVARDAAALKVVSTYLSTGKRSKHLRSTGAAAYERSYLHSSATKPYGASGHVSCAPTRGSLTAALATASGTVVVASLTCTVTRQALPNWRISLKGRWKALASRSSNLRSFSVQFIDEVAMTVTRAGDVRVTGTTWGAVAVRSH